MRKDLESLTTRSFERHVLICTSNSLVADFVTISPMENGIVVYRNLHSTEARDLGTAEILSQYIPHSHDGSHARTNWRRQVFTAGNMYLSRFSD